MKHSCDDCAVCRLQLREVGEELRDAWLEIRKLRQKLESLYALHHAQEKNSAQPVKRWPPEGTSLYDQTRIVNRLLHLSTLTGKPMESYVTQARELAESYKLLPFKALTAVERLAGYTWDETKGHLRR